LLEKRKQNVVSESHNSYKLRILSWPGTMNLTSLSIGIFEETEIYYLRTVS